jgi:hypothetical protein
VTVLVHVLLSVWLTSIATVWLFHRPVWSWRVPLWPLFGAVTVWEHYQKKRRLRRLLREVWKR